MNAQHIRAIEQHVLWRSLLQNPGKFRATIYDPELDQQANDLNARQVMSLFYNGNHTAAEPFKGDTFFFNREFLELVLSAQDSAPESLAFDPAWIVSPAGWGAFEEPITMPVARSYDGAATWVPQVTAVGWNQTSDPEGLWLSVWLYASANAGNSLTPFIRVPLGFGWTLQRALDEWRGAAYATFDGREQALAACRFVFALFHFMAHRLADTQRHIPDRSVRRRAEQNHQAVPAWLTVVTLRRVQPQDAKETRGNAPTRSCRWIVRGHWRNQWYPAERQHRARFIHAYVKGPADLPLKPLTFKLFKAVR